jgi:hypothetical protein
MVELWTINNGNVLTLGQGFMFIVVDSNFIVANRDVNGVEIDWRILYYFLPHHLKYSIFLFPFPASGSILPPFQFPRIPTVLTDIRQF